MGKAQNIHKSYKKSLQKSILECVEIETGALNVKDIDALDNNIASMDIVWESCLALEKNKFFKKLHQSVHVAGEYFNLTIYSATFSSKL